MNNLKPATQALHTGDTTLQQHKEQEQFLFTKLLRMFLKMQTKLLIDLTSPKQDIFTQD